MLYQLQVTNNFQAFLTDLQVTKSFQLIKTFDSILSSGKDHMENLIIISCDLILQMGVPMGIADPYQITKRVRKQSRYQVYWYLFTDPLSGSQDGLLPLKIGIFGVTIWLT